MDMVGGYAVQHIRLLHPVHRAPDVFKGYFEYLN